MAIVLLYPLFWVLIVILALVLLWLAHWLSLRWPLAWLIRFVLLILLAIGIFAPRSEQIDHALADRQVLVIDVSPTISPGELDLFIKQSVDWKTQSTNRIVLLAGANIKPLFTDDTSLFKIENQVSDLANALKISSDLMDGYPGSILLATDGNAKNLPDIDATIQQLVEKGQQLNGIHLPPVNPSNDSYVGQLWAPATSWEQSPFTALLPFYLPIDGEVQIEFSVNGKSQIQRSEVMKSGHHILTFTHQATVPEILTLSASAILAGDTQLKNNYAYSAIQVYPAPKALLVSEVNDQFADMMNHAGIDIDIIRPWHMPTSLEKLGEYQVILLHNLLVDSLSMEHMLALKVFVSQKGGGLVVIGGQQSYTLGGYQFSLIEPILPVKLEPPPRQERQPITFVIVLDRSASMDSRVRGVTPPIELAKEAAIRAIENLAADDYLGVMTFETTPVWNVPIQRTGEGLILREALDIVSQIQASGGTMIYKALNEAITDIIDADTSDSSFILLLSDGLSADGTYLEFENLARYAKGRGIGISTIALGVSSDNKLMRLVAENANGRYHSVLDPTQLPQVMISESRAARSENIQEGETNLMTSEKSHPVLSGLSLQELPSIKGYNALSSKSDKGAEDILVSVSFGDPFLSAWQYGLGRVVAWMGDLGENWTKDWIKWPNYDLFWSNIIRYAVLNPALGPVQVEFSNDDTYLNIRLQIHDDFDFPLNLTNPNFSYMDDIGNLHRFTVPQTEPGVYHLKISRPDEGAYRGIIRYQVGSQEFEIPAYFAVDYPEYLRPVDRESGERNLIDWVNTTGGKIIQLKIIPEITEPSSIQTSFDNFWQRLMLAVVIYWPVDVALRRRWLPWQ